MIGVMANVGGTVTYKEDLAEFETQFRWCEPPPEHAVTHNTTLRYRIEPLEVSAKVPGAVLHL